MGVCLSQCVFSVLALTWSRLQLKQNDKDSDLIFFSNFYRPMLWSRCLSSGVGERGAVLVTSPQQISYFESLQAITAIIAYIYCPHYASQTREIVGRTSERVMQMHTCRP